MNFSLRRSMHALFVLVLLLLVGCGGTAEQQNGASDANLGVVEEKSEPIPTMPMRPEDDRAVDSDAEHAVERAAGAETVSQEEALEDIDGAPAPEGNAVEAEAAQEALPTPFAQTVAFNEDVARKIIKNADLTIEVASVEIAVSRISSAAAQVGGYVLETRTNFGEAGAEGAVTRIAVPVDSFEETLERIRETATQLIDEQTSGTDVTQEYVDIQSQLANLEATQARIREFLDQAETVEEALRVNNQLSQIEAQISQLKGRLEFLSQRAAFSTITVQLAQQPPEITPTPTATPTPTVTPTPEPVWSPGETAGHAYGTLTDVLEVVATAAIWLAVVVIPLLLPVALIGMGVRAWQQRNRSQPQSGSSALPRAATPQEPAESGTSTD